MSNFLKGILAVVIWFIFSFLTFNYCIEEKCCDAEAGGDDNGTTTEEEIQPPPPPTDNYAIASRLGEAAVLTGSQWPNLRSDLLEAYAADSTQTLEIYGHYYEGEAAPEGFESMGFYRASAIRDLLVPDIPADQIKLLSRRLDNDRPAADALWKAGTFNWKAGATGDSDGDGDGDGDGGVEIIEIDDEIIIRFPFNSSVKNVDPAIDDYLLKLAQRLEQTNERVSITGHTDNVDTDAFNMRLGQQRADYIKAILVKDGVASDRITTSSEGESNPVDTNSTAAGRQNNRRAVVKLMPQ